ncbi:9608_t:CDS:1, partial [Gigaspora margarita]
DNKDVDVTETGHFFKSDRNSSSVSPETQNSLKLDECLSSISSKSQLSLDSDLFFNQMELLSIPKANYLDNNPFLESDRNLSSISPKNQLSLDNDPFPTSDKTPSNNNKDSIDEFFSDITSFLFACE